MAGGQRIVSFLPSATEMACALGLGPRLLGVTHECDFPPEVRGKPVVVRGVLPIETMTEQEIDVAVSQRTRDGLSLYAVDDTMLRHLAPDLILTQDLCQVCAPSGMEVDAVLKLFRREPRHGSTPQSLAGIFDNLRELGEATGRSREAEALIAAGRARLTRSPRQRARSPDVRGCFAWSGPARCIAAATGVPEMVRLAGGVDELGQEGAYSVRVAWDDVLRWAPEVLVVMPCGFDLPTTVARAQEIFTYPGWSELPAVKAGCFSRWTRTRISHAQDRG